MSINQYLSKIVERYLLMSRYQIPASSVFALQFFDGKFQVSLGTHNFFVFHVFYPYNTDRESHWEQSKLYVPTVIIGLYSYSHCSPAIVVCLFYSGPSSLFVLYAIVRAVWKQIWRTHLLVYALFINFIEYNVSKSSNSIVSLHMDSNACVTELFQNENTP